MKNVLLLITPSSPGRFAGVARFAKGHGWHLTVADRLTHALNGWTGDGALVTVRDDATTLKQVRSLRRRGIPVVDLTIEHPELQLPRVCGDNAAIGRLAAEHFRARNFRHVSWFSTSWGHQHQLRCDAFSAPEMWKGTGTVPGCWAWSLDPASTKSDDWQELSRWLQKKILDAPRPIGIFCFDDADASRVESVALSAGLDIPGDVAVLGAGDDRPLCESQTIPISSVSHDLETIGWEGAALLEKLMAGELPKTPDEPMQVPPRGISERESTDALAVYSPLVARAIALCCDRLANTPSTEQLADELGVSRATLDRAFSADTGMSPAKLIMRLRLYEAKRLLKAGEKTISEIAYTLGFCNPAYFSNTFSRETGQAPKEWRRLALQGLTSGAAS